MKAGNKSIRGPSSRNAAKCEFDHAPSVQALFKAKKANFKRGPAKLSAEQEAFTAYAVRSSDKTESVFMLIARGR